MKSTNRLEQSSTQLKPDDLLDELRDYSSIANTPGGDTRIASFSAAAVDEYTNNPCFKIVIDSFVESRTDIEQPSLAANILLRSIQKQMLRKENKDPRSSPYPEPFDSAVAWQKAFSSLIGHESSTFQDIMHDLTSRNPQSNIVERYKAFSIIVQLMRGRFDKKPNVLDVGCSQNHGLKRLGLGAQIAMQPFNSVEVEGAGGAALKRKHSRILNTILEYTHGLGDSIGIDLQPLEDPDSQEWARACSFYPSELMDETAMANYDFLEGVEPDEPLIDFYQGDFSDPDLNGFEAHTDRQRFDMVIFSTVLNQVADPVSRAAMLENARRVVKPKGLIVVQDFVQVNPGSELSLRFYKKWFGSPYRYRTCIATADDGFQTFREIMRWDNGRCNKVQLSKAIGQLSIADKMGLGS